MDQHEEALLDEAQVRLIALRRNSKQHFPAWLTYFAQRKRIETVFSRITSSFGRTLHAVTPRGFELKVFLTVLAHAITA